MEFITLALYNNYIITFDISQIYRDGEDCGQIGDKI